MPQEAWPGRGPWPVPATPALVPKQGLRSLVTRSLQIQVISPGSKSPSPPRSCARRSRAPTRKGLGAPGRRRRRLQEPDLGRKMALAGCSWLLLSGEREWCPQNLSPDGLGEGGLRPRPGEGRCEQEPGMPGREAALLTRARAQGLFPEAPARPCSQQWGRQGGPRCMSLGEAATAIPLFT